MNTLQAISLGYSPLHPNLAYSGYAIFIHEQALSFLNERIQDDYSSLRLIKKIIAMRANPRPWDCGIKTGSTDHRQLTIDGLWVNYFIDSGIVYIDEIVNNYHTGKSNELAGLHHVVKENGLWSIKQSYLSAIKTQYAALNGANNNRDSATKLMPEQLQQAYEGEEINEFTLFHNPTQCKFSEKYESSKNKTSQSHSIIERFSQLLESTQKTQQNIKWVTHNQGSALFTQAVEVHNQRTNHSLDKHTVFFQYPNREMTSAKNILRKANVKLHKQGFRYSSTQSLLMLMNKPLIKLQQLVSNSCNDTLKLASNNLDKKFALSSSQVLKSMIRRVV